MNISKIDERFASSPQIKPEDIAHLAREGYRAIICARPDHEDHGQPSFAEIERAAAGHGLAAVHVPVSGQPTEAQHAQMRQALAKLDGPVLGYCRSGGRAVALYRAVK